MAVSGKLIPRPSTFQLLPFNCKLDRNLLVVDLINWDKLQWKRELLIGNVDPHVLELILKIPILMTSRRDELVWHYSANGSYSVWSAYHLALEHKMTSCNFGSSSRDRSSDWKSIWHLHLPPKIKLLLWRACKNFLPVGWNGIFVCVKWDLALNVLDVDLRKKQFFMLSFPAQQLWRIGLLLLWDYAAMVSMTIPFMIGSSPLNQSLMLSSCAL